MSPSRPLVAAAAASIATAAAVGHEGMKLVAYYDPVKIPTICVGRTQNVHMGDIATREQCMTWLGQEVMEAVEQVQRCHPNVDFTPQQLAAFADITYNVGPRPVCDITQSTMARKLAANDVAGACREFPKWDKARIFGSLRPIPGLTKRRAANQALCEGRAQSLGAVG